MLTDQDYDNWAKKLSPKMKCSHHVIRHIRNCRKQKYPELEFQEFKNRIIDDAEKAITAIRQSLNPQLLETIHALSKFIVSIRASENSINQIRNNAINIEGALRKLGLRRSIKNFAYKLTPEQLEEIIADIPDPKEIEK